MSRGRIVTLALTGAAVAGVLAFPASRGFTLEALRRLANPNVAEGVSDLRDLLLPFGGKAWMFTSLLMILQSLAAPIPAVPITLTNALLYGPWLGTLISWASAEAAAALCFVLSRALGRPFVEKLFRPSVLARLDDFFRRDGLVAVLVLRLIPYVSFDVVSYAAGLTAMRLVPFLLATGAGQLPATIVYSLAGARLATDPGLALKLALVFLGIMVLGVAAVAWRLRSRRAGEARGPGDSP